MKIDEYRFCVIGPGRLGSTLIAALDRAGLTVSAVGVHQEDDTGFGGGPARVRVVDAALEADAWWLAVPDDDIFAVAGQLASAMPGARRSGRAPLAIHSSGLGSLHLLKPLHEAGVLTLCLHPLQTFAGDGRADVLDGVPCAVTAWDEAVAQLGEDLARELGMEPFRLADERKTLYHLAAVVASNLLVALESDAGKLMGEATGREDGMRLLAPLLETTVANLEARGPAGALTGPVARGDVAHRARPPAPARPRGAAGGERLPRAVARGARPRGAPARRRDRAHAEEHPVRRGEGVSRPGRQREPPVIVARTIAEARAALADVPRPLGLVPTMGALHEGHLALVTAPRASSCATVAASLFVNPTQFGAGEDLARYPRDEQRDFELFERTGVDVVFAPAADEMYPAGACTTVRVAGPLTEKYEAEQRPGHFDGVATVVVKLFDIVRPDVAFFGEKDAQQLALIRRVVRDLDLPVEVAGVATAARARRPRDELAQRLPHARTARHRPGPLPRPARRACRGAQAERHAQGRDRRRGDDAGDARPLARLRAGPRARAQGPGAARAAAHPHRVPRRRRRRHLRAGTRPRRPLALHRLRRASARPACSTTSRSNPATPMGAYPAADATR